MHHIRQFGLILLFSFIGELLNRLIPLPIPASIYGLVIMLLALSLKILRLDQVQDTAEFLLDIMILMFIPSTVGLIEAWSSVKEILIPALIIIIISTILVMVVSGRTAQWLYRLEKRNKR